MSGISQADLGGRVTPRFWHRLTAFDTSLAVRLRSPLSILPAGILFRFSATLTTMAFDHSSLRWLEINT